MAEAEEKHRAARLAEIDGLRGLAILLVVGFHAFARWPDLMPFATQFGSFAPFRYGYLGVELFFLISGFVILMTLERCRSLPEFLLRRWLRLFPAMLIATVLILLTAPWLTERPAGTPQLRQALIGLFFMDPELLWRATGIELWGIEGAFWSLFVEVKFYLLFGALYFLARRAALLLFSALFAVYHLVESGHLPLPLDLEALNAWTSVKFFGWFAAGAWLYRLSKSRSLADFLPALGLLYLSMRANIGTGPDAPLVGLLLFAVMAAAILHPLARALLSARPLLFFGFLSYPLYLIHENAMVAMAIKLHAVASWLPGLLTPLPGLTLIVGTAFLIARFGEPALRRALLGGARQARRIFAVSPP